MSTMVTRQRCIMSCTDERAASGDGPVGLALGDLRANQSVKLFCTLQEAEDFARLVLNTVTNLRQLGAREILLAGLSLSLLGAFGCSVEPVNFSSTDAAPDVQASPEAPVVSQPDVRKDAIALPAERPDLTPLDSRPMTDLMPDTMPDTMPASSDYGVDLRPPYDARPADAGYANDAGWTPGDTGACCLPCGDYEGCMTLVHTTPFCKMTVGSSCLQGGTESGSVWPQCQPVKGNGGCR